MVSAIMQRRNEKSHEKISGFARDGIKSQIELSSSSQSSRMNEKDMW
jgi:hypothetical protein